MSEYVVVEGEWKEYKFSMCRQEDIPDILIHLRANFYRDEPLCKKLGYGEDLDKDIIMAEDFDATVLHAFSHNLSFIARHKPTNKIAGVRVTCIVRKDEETKEGGGETTPGLFADPATPFHSKKTEIVVNFLNKATEAGRVFETYPDVDHYADLVLTSVDAEFRGQGLVTEMYKRTLLLLKAKGVPLCKSVLTSPFTQRAALKLGFTTLATCYLRDYVDSEGQPYLPIDHPDENITAAALRLL